MSEHESSPMERWPDDRLLRAAHQGDGEAFQVFCVRSLPGLVSYLMAQCELCGVPIDLAVDFAQDTVIKALAQVRASREHAYRPFPKVSTAWLKQIGYNLIMDHLREAHRARSAQRDINAAKPRPPTQEEIDRLEEVHKFYTWLPPAEQEMIELVLVENLSIQEAAAKLGISKPAAYKRYERAVTHLQDFIREHGSLAKGLAGGEPAPPDDEQE
jgi:RNA polymerase sigma factor (sigma-70 family)